MVSSSHHIRIPAGARPEHPVPVPVRRGAKVQIDIAPDAVVTLIEDRMSGPGGGDITVEVHASDRSSVHYISFQTHATDGPSGIHHRATIGREGSVTWSLSTIGGKEVHHDLQSEVLGEGGASTIQWLFFAAGDERQTLAVHTIFSAEKGRGEITMRGVAQDRGHVAARGKIEIGPAGGGTDTFLSQSVLMLDAAAKVDAVPELKITTNDVKASHAASVARVSPEDLFYFASRGIPKAEARRMYVEGFLGEIVERIPEESVREAVFAEIRAKYS